MPLRSIALLALTIFVSFAGAQPSTDWQRADLLGPQTLDPSATQDRVLPVGEIELGTEYARCVGRCRFLVHTALANQVWFGAGNASNNQTITGTGTLLTVPVTQAADNHINLGFLGLTATVGIQY